MPNEEEMTGEATEVTTIDRREMIRRVGFLLGGLTFVGGSSLLTACEKGHNNVVQATIGRGEAKPFAAVRTR